MELHRMIKSDARRVLHSCWGKSVATAMVLFGAYLAVVLTESVLLFVFSGSEEPNIDFYNLGSTPNSVLVIICAAAAAYFLLFPALMTGYKKLHFAFASGCDDCVSGLFDFFSSIKKYVKCLAFTVGLALRYLLCGVIALLPGSALIWAAQTYITPVSRTVEILKIAACCVGIALIMLCLALVLIFSQRWALAPYYLVSGRKLHDCFRLSVGATKGFCAKLLGFKLSFIGWGVLSLLVLPALWSLPYYSVSLAIYAKYLMEKFEHADAKAPEHDAQAPNAEA